MSEKVVTNKEESRLKWMLGVLLELDVSVWNNGYYYIYWSVDLEIKMIVCEDGWMDR